MTEVFRSIRWLLVRLLACILLSSITGCDNSFRDYTSEQSELSKNQGIWQKTNHQKYGYSYTSPGGYVDAGNQYNVDVVDGIVASVFCVTTNENPSDLTLVRHPTVENLFGMIQSAINRRAYNIVVTYDSVIGYPTSVFVDYERNTADEEFIFRIDSFQDTP